MVLSTKITKNTKVGLEAPPSLMRKEI